MGIADSRNNPQRPFRWRPSWLILAALTVLALGLSWPLIVNLSSRVPGTATWAFDESTFLWNDWYLKHALLDLHVSPMHSELIWYPLGIDLILHTYNFFSALIALPLQLAFDLPLASNVTVLLATVLSGFGAYLLALYVLGITGAGNGHRPSDLQAPAGRAFSKRPTSVLYLAAFVAGVIYAFASNRAVYAALGHYNIASTQWLPFFALYLVRTLRRPGLKNAALAGLFFALAALAEMTFASLLALLALVLVAALWRTLRHRRTVLLWLGFAALVALLIWSPVLAPVAREFLTSKSTLTGWGESIKLSADLAGMVTPTDLNPLLGPGASGVDHWQAALRLVEEGKGRFSDINTVFLGYVTLVLALLGIWRARGRAREWIWTALVFGLLALGPLLQINGRYRFSLDSLLPEGVTLPLPFTLLHYIPFINANRAPNRGSVILMLALSVLASYSVAWLLGAIDDRATRRTEGAGSGFRRGFVYLSTCLLAALILIEHLAVPLPTTDAHIPGIYGQISREAGDFAVLQLPLGWRNSFGTLGSEQTQLQYFQTAHGKPIIGGNISRAPDYKMDYFARIPLFRALTDLEMYREVPPDVDSAARAQAGDLMSLYDVRYFITTPPIPGRYPYQDTWQRTEEYALDVLPLEKPALLETDGYRAYRVKQPPIPFPFRLDLGAPGTEPYLGQGWDIQLDEKPLGATATWISGKTADIYLPLAGPGDVTLRLAIAPLSYQGAPAQSVTVSANGVPLLKDQALGPGWQTLEVAVPASATRRGPNRVRLEFGWAASPRQVFPDPVSRAEIGSTGVASPVNLEVHSFDEAYVSAFGQDGAQRDASAGRRGYNVTVIHPRTGKVLDMKGFDTAANSYEADALAAYLKAIRPGQIVVLATKGDATAHLNQETTDAMRSLGSRVSSPADLAGQAHALVGVQGAGAATAAETIAPGDAFLRVWGDFRELAAAVDWAEVGP
jgi:hypothetical protein